MTRDEAKSSYSFMMEDEDYNGELFDYFDENDYHKHIDKIYDDFESRTCKTCKWFDIDESIDPNKHFGWCNNKESCCVSNICTLSFGCNKWESKDEHTK